MRLALSILALTSLFASVGHAQERVTTLEHGEWADTIAALQADVDAPGSLVHVCVDTGDGACAPCGQYTLALDDAGARAFRIDECDSSTGATRIVLVDRAALFDHDDVVPRPRVVTIHAALLRDVASSGGGRVSGGSALSCTARVQPFLRDLEHGTIVYLRPDRYDVRVEHASVTASATDDAWVLSTNERIATEVDYVVVDRATGRQELRGHTSLECSSDTSAEPSSPASEDPEDEDGSSMPTTASLPDGLARMEAGLPVTPPAPPAPPDRSAHFTIRGSVAMDWAFGRINTGASGAIGLRGWLDGGHWLGWSAELAVSGVHVSCLAFDGHCSNSASSAAALSVDALSFSAPFALRISLFPAGGLQVRLGLAPGVTYLSGSNGGRVESTVATGTLFGGLDYEIGWLVIGVGVGYRLLAVPFSGDTRIANAYGQALTMELSMGFSF